MITYYIEKDGQIKLYNTDKAKLERTLCYMPQYKSLPILETERPIDNFQWADTEEYLQKKHLQEVGNQVDLLENKTGLIRAIRELVLAENSGASEFVKVKAQEIETLAKELRK